MSKMGSHCSFGHLKHKLWPKEKLEVKLTIWFPTTKSRESTRFSCVQMVCNIPLKSSRRGATTLLPLKVLWVSERAPTPPSFDVFYLNSCLNLSRSWVCVKVCELWHDKKGVHSSLEILSAFGGNLDNIMLKCFMELKNH